jgi:hypothetical protein
VITASSANLQYPGGKSRRVSMPNLEDSTMSRVLSFDRSYDIAKFMKLMDSVNTNFSKEVHRFTINGKPAHAAIYDGTIVYVAVKENVKHELIRYNVDLSDPTLLQTSPEERIEKALIKMLSLGILPDLLFDNIDSLNKDDTRDVILDDIETLFDYIALQSEKYQGGTH